MSNDVPERLIDTAVHDPGARCGRTRGQIDEASGLVEASAIRRGRRTRSRRDVNHRQQVLASESAAVRFDPVLAGPDDGPARPHPVALKPAPPRPRQGEKAHYGKTTSGAGACHYVHAGCLGDMADAARCSLDGRSSASTAVYKSGGYGTAR
jgi:hypothetical protein